MNENLKFIEGGFPLTNRIWIEMGENLTSDKIIGFINEHISKMVESLNLEVHFFVRNSNEAINQCLIQTLKDIYQFKVGYEKSFPIVSIYYPYNSLDDKILSEINDSDIHRPGIRLYLLASDNNISCDNSLSSMRSLAEVLFEKTQKCQDIGLDSTLFFYLENDTEKLMQLLELRRLTFTWDTSCNMKKPLLQLSPDLKIGNSEVEMLNKYIQKQDGVGNILDTVCGLTSILYRYSENKSVPTVYVPLGGCGAGVSERKLCSNGSTASCFYLSEEIKKEGIYDKCKSCEHVSSCTGCFYMCAIKECKLKDIFDIC